MSATTGGDGTGAARDRLRREYRAFLRSAHPDRGGDPELFAAQLRQWQALLSPAAEPAPAEHRVTAYRRGSWPVRCGRALAAAVRRKRRTRVR